MLTSGGVVSVLRVVEEVLAFQACWKDVLMLQIACVLAGLEELCVGLQVMRMSVLLRSLP